jgi:hypothetical protein
MKTRKKNANGVLGIVAVLLFLGTLAYLDGSGRANSWPEVPNKIIGSRTVPMVVPRSPFVLWKGESELEYEVNGQRHSLWKDASGWNEDRIFVESGMSEQHRPCYTVRFNPANPSEAVAKINPN